MIRAVFFDLVFTLGRIIDPITMEHVSEILFQNGYHLSPQQLDSAFSFTIFVDYLKKGFNSIEELFKNIFKLLDSDIDQDTFRQIIDVFMQPKFTLYNDTVSAVTRLKELGMLTVIATTTPKCLFVPDILELVEFIDYVFTGFEVGYDKSNPKYFEVIFNKLGIRPENTVVIGDNLKLDIENSVKYGCKAILLRRDGDFPDTEIPDYMVTNLTQSVKLIEEIMRSGAPAGI